MIQKSFLLLAWAMSHFSFLLPFPFLFLPFIFLAPEGGRNDMTIYGEETNLECKRPIGVGWVYAFQNVSPVLMAAMFFCKCHSVEINQQRFSLLFGLDIAITAFFERLLQAAMLFVVSVPRHFYSKQKKNTESKFLSYLWNYSKGLKCGKKEQTNKTDFTLHLCSNVIAKTVILHCFYSTLWVHSLAASLSSYLF